MQHPFVSVIIPNYNHGRFLDERILSVLNQTYNNYEIIILDDKSTDNSVEIINKYRSNPHISRVIINEKNSGSPFKQWYKGIQLAKGEWIWIAESDDFCDLDMLKCLMNQVTKYSDVAIVYCTSQLVNSESKLIQPIQQSSNKTYFYKGLSFVKYKMSYGNAIRNASSAIFRRDFALAIDPLYVNYLAAGDRLFWIELAELGNVVCLPSFQNFFRQHQNKVSPRKLIQGVTFREDYQIVKYLERKKIVNPIKGFLVRQQYLRDIEEVRFESEEIKRELEFLWCYNGKLPLCVLNAKRKLFKFLNYYFVFLPIYELRKYGIVK